MPQAAKYVVERRLGRGGMGVVDLAVASDGTRVALKRIALHGSAGALAEARVRIRREAEVLGQLDHPRIVRLLDVVDDGDDVVLVMPWLRGGSLADRVTTQRTLPPDDVDRIADHLLGALATAHRAGVVHRDIKPANVLFDEQSRPHLADFGVATARDITAGLTAAGLAVGTPGFIAPEQARGESAGSGGRRLQPGRHAALGAHGRRVRTATGTPDVLLWRAAQGKVEPLPHGRAGPLAASHRRDARTPCRAPAVRRGAGRWTRRHGRTAGGRDAARRPAAATRAGRSSARSPAVGVAIGVALAVALDDGDDPDRDLGAGAPSTTTTTTCVALPYQPCGAPPAPGTDGSACIDARADYDGDAANGCEAIPDDLDGTELGTVEPTIVPADDTDAFTVEVDDDFQLRCNGRITLELTAPEGMTLRLEVLDEDGELLGELTSAGGVAQRLRLREPDCGGDDGGTLTAVVSPIGSDRSSEPYTLERSGHW